MQLLAALENTGFGTWVRESPSPWAYPGILFLHTVGLAFLVGLNVAIDLRLLGFAKRLPIPPMERFFPVMWVGFWVNAASGLVLFVANATMRATNPAFYLKMGFIAAALVVLGLVRRHAFRPFPLETDASPTTRVLAVVSLLCWCGAIAAGRLLPYFDRNL